MKPSLMLSIFAFVVSLIAAVVTFFYARRLSHWTKTLRYHVDKFGRRNWEISLFPKLYNELRHGDEEHQAWLKKTIEDFAIREMTEDITALYGEADLKEAFKKMQDQINETTAITPKP